MNVLIIGFGNVGSSLYYDFVISNDTYNNFYVYDPYNAEVNEMPNRYEANSGLHFDIAFICVDTPIIEKGLLDTSTIMKSIRKFESVVDTFVIKSTVPVGFTKCLNNKNVLFSPEFSGTTCHSNLTMNFVIISYFDKEQISLCDKVAQLYTRNNPGSFKIIYADSTEAEMAKFMENSYFALKVTFCNDFARACKAVGANYNNVRNMFLLDPRIEPSHTFVYDDQPYYDSHCLNKDVASIVEQFDSDVPLLNALYEINKKQKLEN